MLPMLEIGWMNISQPHGLAVVMQSTGPLVHLILHQLIFLWGHLKEIVYRKSIITSFSVLYSNLYEKVCELVTERFQKCIDADGHQFEHLN